MDFKERTEQLKGKLGDLQDKVRDAAETIALNGLEKKDSLDNAIGTAKGNLLAAQENYRIAAERAQGKASSKLLEAQMNLDAARDEIKKAKAAHDKQSDADAIRETLEYASECQDFADMLVEESKVAMLEAAKLASAYREEYGEEPVLD